jgi:signal recognition particle subunit SRP19
MRKQEKVMIWAAYFDQARTRNEGRRVPKSLAVSSPKILEIQEAAQKIGVEFELVPEKGYSKTPWVKTGLLLVEKKGSKEQVINRIARQLLKVRNEAPKRHK